jgi:hypothetical protein
LPPPFEAGWKAAELRVISETNIAGLKLPLEFVYEQFKPKRDAAKADDVESQFQVSATDTAFQVASVPEVRPPATEGTTLVEERRFSTMPAGLSGVQYVSTNRQLSSAPNARAVEQHKPILAASGMEDKGSDKPHQMVKILTLALLALSAGAFVLAVMKKQTTRTQRKGFNE